MVWSNLTSVFTGLVPKSWMWQEVHFWLCVLRSRPYPSSLPLCLFWGFASVQIWFLITRLIFVIYLQALANLPRDQIHFLSFWQRFDRTFIRLVFNFSIPDSFVASRQNAGWRTSKSRGPCQCQNCSPQPPGEETRSGPLLNVTLIPPPLPPPPTEGSFSRGTELKLNSFVAFLGNFVCWSICTQSFLQPLFLVEIRSFI